jgi:TetR/AcrR family transcriptional regulator, transcriptional repressor for nem operon
MIKKSKSQRTREFIIEQVAPVFNKKGYVGTALSDIEKATGLTKGAIYGNFGNKNNLAEACFERNILPLQKGVHNAIGTTGGALSKLAALLDFYRTHYDEVADNGGCPLLNTATEVDDTFPLMKDKVQRSILNWKNELSAVIRKGQLDGEIRSVVNADKFSTAIIAMIEGGIMLAKAMDDKKYFLDVIDSIEFKINNELKIK